MKRLVILCILLALVVAPALAQEAPAVEPWVCPEGYEGQTLNVYNWTIYIAEDTIPNFEAACGVDVVYDNYFTNEELLAKLQQGNPGYDVIVPSDYMVAVMIEEGILEPLDPMLIPNIANVSTDMLSPWYDEGNVYTVPYQWGTAGIAYNRTATGGDITSWEQFFTYDGSVAWLEDLRGMLGIGLLMSGFDVNSEDPDEIEAAKQYLLDHSDNVAAIVAGNSKQLLSQGEVDLAVDYNGNVYGLIAECAADPNCTTEYAYTIPVEGASRWTDNLAIPVGAQNAPLANVFIDYILHPQVSADISNYVTYGTPNQVALDLGLIDAATLDDPNIYPPESVRANLFQINPVPPDVETYYNDAWDELKIAIGS
ncbi:MAG: spermidine/putrescine ABC transporter substrate-binding protein [Chloroflexota bacterium]|nr:spermidine/putrescine ABC transporter substrate-binding protein [Chloroflexota bacterium]